MSGNELSKRQQSRIVKKIMDEVYEEGEFNEESYDRLDFQHQMQVDREVRQFADDAVGSEHWDSDA